MSVRVSCADGKFENLQIMIQNNGKCVHILLTLQEGYSISSLSHIFIQKMDILTT